MIKAVIFDCFGVLATEAWLPFKAKYFTDPEVHEEAESLMKQANSGLINNADFLQGIAKLAGLTPEAVLEALRHNVPNEPLFDYMRNQLKPKYKLGFLSNVSGDYLQELFTPDQLKLFDAISLSYKTGHVKPEPKAYSSAADELGVLPEECVFVDDRSIHVNGALDAGMKAVLYEDFESFKHQMDELLADAKG